eukprot:scaffold211796_cov39-Tisochrysis_lutea.AAC.3
MSIFPTSCRPNFVRALSSHPHNLLAHYYKDDQPLYLELERLRYAQHYALRPVLVCAIASLLGATTLPASTYIRKATPLPNIPNGVALLKRVGRIDDDGGVLHRTNECGV